LRCLEDVLGRMSEQGRTVVSSVDPIFWHAGDEAVG
jgi:hypothetical protein